jgi:hypothetical protein
MKDVTRPLGHTADHPRTPPFRTDTEVIAGQAAEEIWTLEVQKHQ